MISNKVAISVLGAITAALGVIVAAPVVTWHTGVQAAIAGLGVLAVPAAHNAATGSAAPADGQPEPTGGPLPDDPDVGSAVSLLPLGTPGAGGTEMPPSGPGAAA